MTRWSSFPLRLSAMMAVAAGLALVSCGGGNGNTTPSELSPALKAKWDGYCAYRTACAVPIPCATSMCMASVAEEGPLGEFVDCQMAKSCDANDDDCVAMAGTTDAEREAFTARCQQVLSTGSAPACQLETSICTIVAYPLVRKQYMRAVDACLTVACEQRAACIDAAIAPLDCF